MSREIIVDAGLKNKVFGSKYVVSPRQSKSVQEKVFSLGGHWGTNKSKTNVINTDKLYLFVSLDGRMTYGDETDDDHFNDNGLIEMYPDSLTPVNAGKTQGEAITQSGFAKAMEQQAIGRAEPSPFDSSIPPEPMGCDAPSPFEPRGIFSGDAIKNAREKIDEIMLSPLQEKEYMRRYDSQFKQTTNLNNTGDTNMRQTVTLELYDDDKGLPVENSLVAIFEDIVTEDSDATTIQETIMVEDVAGEIEAHNKKRVEIVNEEILNRTGNEVKLRAIKLKDLRWNVKR